MSKQPNAAVIPVTANPSLPAKFDLKREQLLPLDKMLDATSPVSPR